MLNWFEAIPNKSDCAFTQLDIKEFYPNISEKCLKEAIKFAKTIVPISDDDLKVIHHCRKFFLFKDEIAWKKKNIQSSFDVTMGSFDGAEICELIGLFIQSQIMKKLPKENVGLYRDDGLILLRRLTGRQTDIMRKFLIAVFKKNGFDIEIITNLKEVNFLDVTLNLANGTYCPYKKPNDELLYINTASNHPPNIIKQLPETISERLSRNSSDETIFNTCKRPYEEALKKAGYKAELKYKPPRKKTTSKNRKCKIIWFNPPYSKTVKTNVAKMFLRLVAKHFPKNNKLHKIFNKNTVKVSYSCTSNVKQIIKSHNNKILSNPNTKNELNCNCSKECPIDGKCRTIDSIYKCIVTTDNKEDKVYIGLAGGTWKRRYANHVKSFKHETYEKETSLSQYIWKLKRENVNNPVLNWSILGTAPLYSNISKKCQLCLQEKLRIITYENTKELLNKRSELISKCRHERNYLLMNFKSKD